MLRAALPLGLAALVAAQPVPLPNTMDGFVQGDLTAPVQLEMFADLLCPDCLADFPVIQSVAAHYGPQKLQWRLHFFPLPYHTWAFMAAQTAHVIKSVNGSDAAVFAFADYMYNQNGQNQFEVGVTQGNSTLDLQKAYAAAVAGLDLGVTAADVVAGLNDGNINEDTRISWKYGCARYTTGTPNYAVNGLPVDAGGFTLAQWEALLDPLYSAAATSPKARAAQRALHRTGGHS